ncbi:hypothetical protein Rsub_08917 [Raphidocelis subcapitata]|uniref:Uncharacterized protein n=1 Tax=Raphidocelis subcapitata TaxID=307507 RepID=A0A2V0P9C2_9CHLO|nr:hypothetical protein Rsub_08917 [Raphidocelis subcapitata]|eukprot:GBF96169.1 hypothetical protein Rsub_08917 [Raphidocelis subcapitata]
MLTSLRPASGAAARCSGGPARRCAAPPRQRQRPRRAPLPPPRAAAEQAPGLAIGSAVRMSTLPTCELAVAVYPRFKYNAADGGGSGRVADLGGGKLRLTFDPAELNIPALNWRTASIFGVPIPPPLNIAIVPQRFEGTLDRATGVMELSFLARFEFTAGSLYKAPPLIVETVLTTEHSEGQIHSADGRRLGPDGSARLVGVARVPRVEAENDWWTNIFLMLPTDALAVMDARFEFSD